MSYEEWIALLSELPDSVLGLIETLLEAIPQDGASQEPVDRRLWFRKITMSHPV